MPRVFKLVIKTPSQKVPDQTIDCNAELQVLALKRLLTEIYPTKPSINEQRLIYSGHLLADSSKLKDIFGVQESAEEQSDTYTVHLVCNPNMNSVDNSSTSKTFSSNTPEINTEENSAINLSTTTPNTFSIDPNLITNNIQWNFASNSNADAQQIAQQIYVMQQNYVQQMAQYFQNWQNFTNSTNSQSSNVENNQVNTPLIGNIAPSIPVIPFIASGPGLIPYPMLTVHLQPTEQLQSANTQQQQQQQQQPIGLRAPEVVEEAPAAPVVNDVENVDILDQLYTMVQTLLVLTLFYLYSSVARLLFMALFFAGVRMFRRFAQRRQAQANAPAPDLAAQRMQNMMDQQIDDVRENLRRRNLVAGEPVATNGNESDPNITSNNIHPTEPQISKIRFIWLAVSSLFTSLMPENPAVNLN